MSKAQLKWSSTRLKVPVLVADGEVITESNEIMDRVVAAAAKEGVTGGRGAGREKGGRTWLGRGKTAGGPVPGDALAEEWRRWSDEKFVR